MGFRVQGLGFRVYIGFRVPNTRLLLVRNSVGSAVGKGP